MIDIEIFGLDIFDKRKKNIFQPADPTIQFLSSVLFLLRRRLLGFMVALRDSEPIVM
jgi:hypothetical protein